MHNRILKEIARESGRLGLPVYIVGGCVRDWVLKGRNSSALKDLDLACEGDPAPLADFCLRRWGGKAQSFGEFGTVRLHLKNGLRVDFARARSETYSRPVALPQVSPSSLLEDLARRDFSVNAMAIELAGTGGRGPGTGGKPIPHPQSLIPRIIDPFGGIEDLKTKTLRILHPRSFEDDPTRIFRAARFLCRFEMKMDSGTEKSLQKALKERTAELLSRERLRQELLAVLKEKDPGPVLGRLKEWRLLRLLHPKLFWRKSWAASTDPSVRLGLMAMDLGLREGDLFIQGLHLERPLSLALQRALEIFGEKASPREELPALAREVLIRFGAPVYGLKPLWIGGEDLKKAGLAPGKSYRDILDRAARAQWKGRFSSRRQALAWLKEVL